ncbi:glycoside hydrolase family 2 protein [Chitinophaga caseinilytica]|uniref:beta-galactosidase n=1 Tax=Chitinophaga caseinilytica TaxID=2267521 RepID=A0ABZ2Z0Z1_9BACT
MNQPLGIGRILLLLLPFTANAQQFMAGGRQQLAPIPAAVSGVKQVATSLAGTWEIQLNGQKDWKPVQVPGEPAMQGFAVAHDQPFRYKKSIHIPAEANGRQIAIRFNGVYSYARVFINGKFVREHFGGFTAWECDLTAFVKAGSTADLEVEVTDRTDDISFAAGYAHHPIGGILRDVQLIVRPNVHAGQLYASAQLADDLTTGRLSLDFVLKNAVPATVVSWSLTAPDGKRKVAGGILKTTNGAGKHQADIPGVLPWTAETPQLYRLDVTVSEKGKKVTQYTQPIGFRTVVIGPGNQLLVNGKPVKLRGACRHDMHPLLGRSTHRGQDSLDVVLAREANLNFIRTSHYPPSADFLEFCDRYGIYVQEETAICFVGQDRGGEYNKFTSTQNDTAFTSRYLGQLSEMIDRDRNHASVIMWSIGNESSYGSNFQQEYDFVKQIDPSRPVSWSWPMTALKENKRCFDIAVGHYPAYDGKGSDMGGVDRNMAHPDFPLLSDEWAHVACYNVGHLRNDPNVKDFWGRSMDTTWLVRFDVPGNIGGAIWGMIDETFHLPGKVTGYGPWGFVDVWRRKKAEFWNTKKAYSPVRVGKTHFDALPANGILEVPVKNRFDHLSLSQIVCKIESGGKAVDVKLPPVAPHQNGVIALPVKGISVNGVMIRFYDPAGALIDEERISWGPRGSGQLPVAAGSWQFSTDKNVQRSGDVELRNYGRLAVKGSVVVTGKPQVVVNRPENWNAFKNTPGIFSGNMTVAEEQIVEETDRIVVRTRGVMGAYPVALETSYFPNGLVEVRYTANSLPRHTWEIGVKIPLAPELSRIAWRRQGYWSSYPAGHLSADSGAALKNSGKAYHYRQQPEGSIAEDMTDYYLNATTDERKAGMHGSEGFRGKKEHIFEYEASRQNGPGRIRVLSDGSQAARMDVEADGKQWLVISDKWDYWSLAWGNFQGLPNPSKQMKGIIRFIIE